MIKLLSIAWRQRLWHAFVNWFIEPIPFPGMTFEPQQGARKIGSNER